LILPKKPKTEFPMDTFIKQLMIIMKENGFQKPANLGEDLGMNVSRWFPSKKGAKTNTKSVELDTIMLIAEKYNKSLDWLLTGEEPKGALPLQPLITIAGTQPEIPADIRVEDYLAVPLAAGLVGASYEGAIPWDYIAHLVWVYKPELGRRQWHNLRAIKVANQANSMTPTIRPGDIVIVDPEERPPQQPLDKKAIYAVRLDEHGNAAIKRVREFEDMWILLSDNLECNPIMVKKADVPNLIIGKVIWSWTSWVRS
jgi:phage repressor protein C with HTH and peptisase S24 domain